MTGFVTRGRLAVGAVLCIAIGASALADTKVADAPAVLKRLIDCRKVADEHARLACYDSAIDEMTASLSKGDIVAVDRAQMATVRKQAFGFTLPSLSLFDRGEKPDVIDRVSVVLDHATQRGDGTWVLTLEDGAVWSQVDQEPMHREPHKGSKVEIRKASLGTYFLNVDGQRAIRAQRVK